MRDGVDYLKKGGLLQQPEGIVNELLQEARFYNIRPLVDYIAVKCVLLLKNNQQKSNFIVYLFCSYNK